MAVVDSQHFPRLAPLKRVVLAIGFMLTLPAVGILGGVVAYAYATGGIVTLDFTQFGELAVEFYVVTLVMYPATTLALAYLIEAITVGPDN